MKLSFIVLLLISGSLVAKSNRIYSLGFGLNSVSSESNAIENIDNGSFVRLSHEGLLAKNLLYVVGAGYSKNDLKVNYEYEGRNTTTIINEFDAESTRIEARLGVKYNIAQWLYLGAGALVGDFRIEYDRDDYVDESSETDNFVKSENQNYFGSYGEIGLMSVYKRIGFRIGAEYSSVSLSDELNSLGDSRPGLSDQKLYVEVLWKN